MLIFEFVDIIQHETTIFPFLSVLFYILFLHFYSLLSRRNKNHNDLLVFKSNKISLNYDNSFI